MLQKNKFGQVCCEHCFGWHFALYLDENNQPNGEIKCIRCGRFYNMFEGVKIEAPSNEELAKLEEKQREEKRNGK